ncbi:MAG: NUDIX hydrolase [Acidimicrobiia bacterium]|nr:NUDIX hydrolase [Acidimicrobiia bacterium]
MAGAGLTSMYRRRTGAPSVAADIGLAAAQIGAVETTEPVVEGFRAEMLRFLGAEPEALSRSCRRGHLTGSALVVDHGRHRVLLLHHAKLGRWLQPGGHADGDGDLAAVARREATEETGIDDLVVVEPAVDLDIHEIPERGSEPTHLHLDVRFLVLAPRGARAVGNHESTAMRWITEEALGDHEPDAGLERLVRAGLAAARELST